jgi:hypothetical protein
MIRRDMISLSTRLLGHERRRSNASGCIANLTDHIRWRCCDEAGNDSLLNCGKDARLQNSSRHRHVIRTNPSLSRIFWIPDSDARRTDPTCRNQILILDGFCPNIVSASVASVSKWLWLSLCPLWVISRHPRRKKIMSALPPKADIDRRFWNVR